MTKNDVLQLFETDMSDPGSYKSGEYLREHVLQHAKGVLSTDRSSLVEALREWLKARSEPRTMIAVTVARKLDLKELKSDIQALRNEVADGRTFPRFYLDHIDAAVNALA